MSNKHFEILKFFLQGGNHKQCSPKQVDTQMKFGINKIITLFLDLEFYGFIQWVSLNLVDMNLERSTKEIYNEIYNSPAVITAKGELHINNAAITNQAS